MMIQYVVFLYCWKGSTWASQDTQAYPVDTCNQKFCECVNGSYSSPFLMSTSQRAASSSEVIHVATALPVPVISYPSLRPQVPAPNL